jgi:hypothetical protein
MGSRYRPPHKNWGPANPLRTGEPTHSTVDCNAHVSCETQWIMTAFRSFPGYRRYWGGMRKGEIPDSIKSTILAFTHHRPLAQLNHWITWQPNLLSNLAINSFSCIHLCHQLLSHFDQKDERKRPKKLAEFGSKKHLKRVKKRSRPLHCAQLNKHNNSTYV